MNAALATTAGVILAALVTAIGVLVGHAYARIARVEERLDRASEENRHLWLWARRLVDYGYTWRRGDAPDMPTLEDTITREKGKSNL